MAVGTNHWKLGLFVIVGVGLMLAVLIVLGARRWNDQTVTYVSFFDESVQGLEVGSPVKFRGVTIGRVAAIDVALDHRHVQVTNELFVEQLGRLDLRFAHSAAGTTGLTGLRMQLAQAGITGVKFMLLDYFDGQAYPPLILPFKTPPNTIPSTPSTMKNLEDSVVRTANQFPDIASALLGTVSRLNVLMADVDREQLPASAAATLAEGKTTLHELRAQIQALNAGALSAHAEQSMASFNQTLANTDKLLSRLDSDKGLVRSAERAANSMNEVARGAQAVGPELEQTLREVRDAARSVHRFVDALQRDPDMLLKGRAEARR
jgi:phospholipid/cholesterol/gamma-HCH transport system substrate-binding protein